MKLMMIEVVIFVPTFAVLPDVNSAVFFFFPNFYHEILGSISCN